MKAAMNREDAWLASYYGKLSCEEFILLTRAQRTLLGNILEQRPLNESPLPWAPLRGILPSCFHFRGTWNWDSAFHAVGVSRWDSELAREQIKIFLDNQLPSGLLPDVIRENGEIMDDYGKPPVFPWAMMIVDQRAPDDKFLERAYHAFVKYEEHWRRDRGGDHDGLFHYDSSNREPATRIQHAKWESGWDDSVRWDTNIFDLWPIDLNCYMVLLYRAMSYMATRLGLKNDIARWKNSEDTLISLINEKLYDEKSGAYLDYDFKRQAFVNALSPASFMPLYIRIASPQRAAQMAKHADDPAKFNPGWPTIAYDHPQYVSNTYWRGRTWLNVAYFALKGLKYYGYDNIADEGRKTILNWVSASPDYIYENYDSRSGARLGARQFSWSAVFVTEFILNWNKNDSY